MDDLVRQGKVHYWGTSVWPGELLQDAHDLCDRRGLYAPMVEQPQYSLVERGIDRAGSEDGGSGPRLTATSPSAPSFEDSLRSAT